MKPSFRVLQVVLVLSFSVSITFAQKVINKNENMVIEKSGSAKKLDETTTAGDKIQFKDGTTTLFEINSEGSAGSLIFPSVGSTLSGTKLYNYGGNLYWGSTNLSSGITGNGWTDNGLTIYNTTLSDKVGIGISEPIYPLHVQGNNDIITIRSLGSNSRFAIENINGYVGYLGTYTGANDIDIGTANTTGSVHIVTNAIPKLTILAGGNIGIGNTTPSSKLSINASGDSKNTIHAESNLDDGRGVFGSATNNDANSQNYGGYFRSSGGNGRGVFGFTNGINSYAVYGNTSGSNAVGVLGNTTGSTGIGVKGTAENNGNLMNYGGYFEASGQLGRGVYGSASNAFGQNFGGFFVANGEDGAAVYADGSSTTWAGFFLGDVNITESLTVNGVNVTSDSRFKKNILQIENTLSFLEKINVYTYNWNSEKYPERKFKNDKLQYGVLAQELEEVYPDLVKTDKDGYKSVDYIKLSVITLQAVKELKIENHELKRKNVEYKSHNVEMEIRLSKIESLLDGEKFTKVSSNPN